MYYQWLVFATLVTNVPPATPPPPQTYISERLSVSLHGANAPDAPVVKQVNGGAPVKVLSRVGALLKIRTEDGSVGWVDPALVTTDKPAQLLYQELSDRFAKAQETIKALHDKPAAGAAPTTAPAPQNESKIVADLRAEIKNTLEHAVELEKHIRDNSTQVNEAVTRIRELEAENAALKGQLATKPAIATTARAIGNFFPAGTAPGAPKFSVSLPWFLASLGLVLLLGGAVGWFVMDRRLRKSHGGFRVEP